MSHGHLPQRAYQAPSSGVIEVYAMELRTLLAERDNLRLALSHAALELSTQPGGGGAVAEAAHRALKAAA